MRSFYFRPSLSSKDNRRDYFHWVQNSLPNVSFTQSPILTYSIIWLLWQTFTPRFSLALCLSPSLFLFFSLSLARYLFLYVSFLHLFSFSLFPSFSLSLPLFPLRTFVPSRSFHLSCSLFIFVSIVWCGGAHKTLTNFVRIAQFRQTFSEATTVFQWTACFNSQSFKHLTLEMMSSSTFTRSDVACAQYVALNPIPSLSIKTNFDQSTFLIGYIVAQTMIVDQVTVVRHVGRYELRIVAYGSFHTENFSVLSMLNVKSSTVPPLHYIPTPFSVNGFPMRSLDDDDGCYQEPNERLGDGKESN